MAPMRAASHPAAADVCGCAATLENIVPANGGGYARGLCACVRYNTALGAAAQRRAASAQGGTRLLFFSLRLLHCVRFLAARWTTRNGAGRFCADI